MKTRYSQRDWVLLLILLAINLLSGGTTVLGAMQVLPRELAFIAGIAVQVMLFCLLAGWAMRHSVIRRGIAIFFFSVISIYTSFFCYYDVLTGDTTQRDIESKAIGTHQTLIAEVYTTIEEQELALRTEATRLNNLAEQECTTGITTGERGCGRAAREFRLQAAQKESEAQRLKATLESLNSKFNYDPTNLTPTQIYQRDLAAWSATPEAFRSTYKVNLDDYINRELDVTLLTPYYKVFKSESREASAILAFLIAISVDGMAILQGTAIEIQHRRITPLQFLSQILQSVIRDFKCLLATFDKEINSVGIPVSEEVHKGKTYYQSLKSLRRVIALAHEESHGKGDIFLLIFLRSIAPTIPHIIQYEKLLAQGDVEFQDYFSSLIRKMSDTSLNWIQIKRLSGSREVFVVPERSYSTLIDWIEKERIRLKSSSREAYLDSIDLEEAKTDNKEEDFYLEEENWREIFRSYNKKDDERN